MDEHLSTYLVLDDLLMKKDQSIFFTIFLKTKTCSNYIYLIFRNRYDRNHCYLPTVSSSLPSGYSGSFEADLRGTKDQIFIVFYYFQNKVYQEVRTVLGDGDPSPERMKQLRYLKACMQESHRMLPTTLGKF